MTKKVLHYPRLDTVIRVEKVIRDSKNPLSKNEIDRRLKLKIMRSTLNLILEYLEDSNKIGVIKDGIVWIHEDGISNNLKERLRRSVKVG
jgi:hypothetical protein